MTDKKADVVEKKQNIELELWDYRKGFCGYTWTCGVCHAYPACSRSIKRFLAQLNRHYYNLFVGCLDERHIRGLIRFELNAKAVEDYQKGKCSKGVLVDRIANKIISYKDKNLAQAFGEKGGG